MAQESTVRNRLRTPRSAAIAGILFSLLLMASIVLLKLSIASNAADAGKWLVEGGHRISVTIAVNLIPFAGIAFLWFIGVVRDRLGEREDRFFSTVFLGSGLLFIAMLFASTAVAIGLIASFHAAPKKAVDSEIWTLGRNMTFALLNVFAMRMSAVFMISTSAIALRTRVINRWLAYAGLAIALVLLVNANFVTYISLLFPLWILVVSVDILVKNLKEGGVQPGTSQDSGS